MRLLVDQCFQEHLDNSTAHLDTRLASEARHLAQPAKDNPGRYSTALDQVRLEEEPLNVKTAKHHRKSSLRSLSITPSDVWNLTMLDFAPSAGWGDSRGWVSY
jgi:hypothetical protein